MSCLHCLCLFVGGIMSCLRCLCLFVGGIMSCLHCLCLFPYSGVQHILRSVFVLFMLVLCSLYCPFGNLFRVFIVFAIIFKTSNLINVFKMKDRLIEYSKRRYTCNGKTKTPHQIRITN
jgi:hypothetical protein